MAALLSSLEEKLYQEDPSKKIDSRLLEDCNSWVRLILRIYSLNRWPHQTILSFSGPSVSTVDVLLTRIRFTFADIIKIFEI